MLVSGIQQSDSVIYIQLLFFQILFPFKNSSSVLKKKQIHYEIEGKISSILKANPEISNTSYSSREPIKTIPSKYDEDTHSTSFAVKGIFLGN